MCLNLPNPYQRAILHQLAPSDVRAQTCISYSRRASSGSSWHSSAKVSRGGAIVLVTGHPPGDAPRPRAQGLRLAALAAVAPAVRPELAPAPEVLALAERELDRARVPIGTLFRNLRT